MRSSPKKAPSPKKPGRPPKGGAAKAKKAPASKSKGKGKAKEASQSTLAADDDELTALDPIQSELGTSRMRIDIVLTSYFCAAAPASSPTKQKGLAAPEAFGSQSLVTGRATRQTAEERKAGWNMLYFPVGRPIWVHRRMEGEGGFWWPGEVSLQLVSNASLSVELTLSVTGQIETSIFARPLSVKLYLDGDETIKNFTCVSGIEYSASDLDSLAREIHRDVHLKIEEPDSELLATFRNPSRLRFDQRIFRDREDAPADGTPTDEAFATVLAHALERDASADEADDEDDLMPTPFGPSGPKAARATALEDEEASDDLEQLELAEPGQFSGDEADRLIEADAQEAEDAKCVLPPRSANFASNSVRFRAGSSTPSCAWRWLTGPGGRQGVRASFPARPARLRRRTARGRARLASMSSNSPMARLQQSRERTFWRSRRRSSSPSRYVRSSRRRSSVQRSADQLSMSSWA